VRIAATRHRADLYSFRVLSLKLLVWTPEKLKIGKKTLQKAANSPGMGDTALCDDENLSQLLSQFTRIEEKAKHRPPSTGSRRTSLRGLYKATFGWLFFVPILAMAPMESARAATKPIAPYQA